MQDLLQALDTRYPLGDGHEWVQVNQAVQADLGQVVQLRFLLKPLFLARLLRRDECLLKRGNAAAYFPVKPGRQEMLSVPPGWVLARQKGSGHEEISFVQSVLEIALDKSGQRTFDVAAYSQRALFDLTEVCIRGFLKI